MNWLHVVWMSFQVSKNDTFLWLNLFCVPAHGRHFSVHSLDSPLRTDATTHPPPQEVSHGSLRVLLPPCSASRDSLALVLWQGSGHGCIPWPRHAPPQGSLFKWSSPSCSSAWSYPCPFKMRCAFLSPRLLSSHCDFLPLITPSWAVSPFITTSHTIPIPKCSNNSAEILSDRSDAWLGFIASEA